MACKICPHGRRENTCSRCRPESTFERHKREARRRKKTSELTFAQYSQIVSGNCAWCGSWEPMVVDRWDSNRHYYFENSQALCNRCNQIKWDSSEREVWDHLKRIIAYRIELAAAAALAAGYIKPEAQQPEAQQPEAQPVVDEEPAAQPPTPVEPRSQRLADLARCVPTPPHTGDYLDPKARAFLEGHG
jgi:hypothetical protein